jgi:HAE1 family hydrophobic/amphiphilic exporter-1
VNVARPFVLSACLAVVVSTLTPLAPAGAQDSAPYPTPATLPMLPPVPTVAPGYRRPKTKPSPAHIVGVAQPFVGISLQDVIGMALLKNPNLAVSVSNSHIARYQIVQAKAPFDMQFRVEPSSSFQVTPPTNLFAGGPPIDCVSTLQNLCGPNNVFTHQSGFQYGLGGQTKAGTQYSAGIQQQRVYNNTGFNFFDPYYLASLNVSVSQPLLKNFGMNAGNRQLRLALINEDSAAAQSLIDTSNTLSQVEQAYWSLVAAWRNVAIQEDALKDAVTQQNSNVRLLHNGYASRVDVVQVSTQVATFRDQVYSALENVADLQNDLKALVVTDPDDPIWKANLVPTQSVLDLPSAEDLDAIVAAAKQNRPEVRQVADKQREADVDRAYARNQALPQADLNAQYMSNGFAGLLAPQSQFQRLLCGLPGFESGTGGSSSDARVVFKNCPTPPPHSQGIMAYAYHNLWAALYPSFNINLTVSFPLQNDLANGLRGQAAEEERQAKILKDAIAERISYEARNALQRYDSALSRLDAAGDAREAAEHVYASELRRFHDGQSTTFLVLQREVQLNEARGRELLAQTDLNKSVVELQRVEGTILTNNGVDLKTMGSQALATAPPSPAAGEKQR